MSGRVPIARRALFQDRRRAFLAASGVAAALLLVLLLQGIFDGAMRQVTHYLRHSEADVIVSQRDVRTMHMSLSSLSPDVVATARRVDGVGWAEGIRYTTSAVTGRGRQQLSYVIGYDPATGRGGPRRLTSGRAPRSGEIIVERVAADRLGVGIGDTVQVFGDQFRITGLFRGGTTIANSIVFITTDDFARRRGDAVAYVLIAAADGVDADELATRLQTALPGETVQTRAQFTREEASLVKDMSADVMRIMSVVGFLIALAVIGLSLFSLTLAKLREHAVVKALGAPGRRLAQVVVTQALWSVALAATLAAVAAYALAALIGRVDPAITIAITAASLIRVGLAAVLVGAFGALIPLRRVAAVDPASAFRRAS